MRTLLAATLALTAVPAFAHPGDHTQMAAADAARHALGSPDHLVVIGMLAAIVALPLTRLALSRIRR